MRSIKTIMCLIPAVVMTLGIWIGTAAAATLWPESWPGTVAGENTAKSAAVVSERAFDFGEVEPEATVSHDFIVENLGQGNLTIEQVSPG